MGQGTDKAPRSRRLKSAAEKAVTAASKVAQKAATAAMAKQVFVASLSSGHGATSSACPPAQELGEDHRSDGTAAGGIHSQPPANVQDGGGEQQAADVEPAAPTGAGTAPGGEQQPPPKPAAPRPAEAPGDDVTCVDIGEKDGALDGMEPEDSAMKIYSKKIMERLRKELSTKGAATDNWLLRKLRENGWWLRAANARDTMMIFSASRDPSGWANPFYLRDIYIWLPDERWDEMPACPRCHSKTEVHRHDFFLTQPTRR